MGKRKYNTEENELPKKKKGDPDPETFSEDVEGQPENVNPRSNESKTASTNHVFDVKHFRKVLAGKQGQTMALPQFLQVCLNPDNEVDYISEYLKIGGNSHEILRQISQDNKKNLTLATPAFHLFYLIILKVQSSLPHMISITEEACRYFINTFMSTAEIMISENSGPRHRKIILKLFTSIVTLNPDLGIELLSQAPLTPKHLQYIVEKTNYKEKDNVRTAFVHFMTSFLVDGHLPLIKALLEKQGLLALVVPGLGQDEAEAVLMFLNILKSNIIDNTLITKSLKLKTFSHQFLHNMFKIYSWKGPPELSNDDRNLARPEIMSLLSDIILTLFTSHKLGLYFVDNTLGTGDANKNQNLYKALLTLKRPWENEHACDAILEIIYKCPDLHRAVINVVEQSFEPQHSPIWEKTVDFTIKLLDKCKPEEMISRMVFLSSSQKANFVRFLTLPVPLLKFIQTRLGNDKIISLYCVKVLVKMLDTLKRYMKILEMEDTQANINDLKSKLEYFFPKHLPAVAAIVLLIQDVISGNKDKNSKDYILPKPDDTQSLIYLMDLLLFYNEIHPVSLEALESTIDVKNILEHSMTLTDEYAQVLRFKVVSLWIMLDSSSVSLKNPMFKQLFHIMLQVYTSDTDYIWIEAEDTLCIFLKNTGIFEADEDEINLMLYTLRNCKINPPSLICDIVEYVLQNRKELSEYIRNQIVHFEISDENIQTSLNKLFNDLMENRCTDDNVFLENKIPSPFIVGCMQYIQSNREAKKHLKHFLSLYVANLLHSNYCPELTEVLIGDCKLDVRSYVASWIGEPAALPEGISGKDNILHKISKSIISNEDISITNIFTYLEETSEEESDITVSGFPYKINTMKNINGSELFILAKYLIFCIIRLTVVNQFKGIQQQKITYYFECIIALCKKLHMMSTCRRIILTLFKNPHTLKIFSPLNSQKSDSTILATEFILQVVTSHSVIVKHLNQSLKLLKPYQQKNANEITKIFIKINKDKSIGSNTTARVLDIIGLSPEDDLQFFDLITNTNISLYVTDNKEPNLILDILRVLIEKYAKTVSLELSKTQLRKVMKLYADLLTFKEITLNLTNIEDALAKYFRNKPYQVKCVSADVFKHFFCAKAVRKSTTNLASILLKYNIRLCNVLKEQVTKSEILSQRELTLPLSNAAIEHQQFLLENKEFLMNIFNEYKTNIIKQLHKPHKTAQIYTSCQRIIRKLLLECLDLRDCRDYFSKTHKFEVVEQSHVNLMQAVFLKLCFLDEQFKRDYLINYFLSSLNMITFLLKEGKVNDAVKDLLHNINDVIQIIESIKTLNVDQKEEFKNVIENTVWQSFCKAVLKDSLKVNRIDQEKTFGPQLLSLLISLVDLFYPLDHEDIVTLFDMVTSHSEFLNVMLSLHSFDIKLSLLRFLYLLIIKNETVMKPQQIPVYLSAYHATNTSCDKIILNILHYYECHGQPVNDYKPYVWGDSAANQYAVRKNRNSSLWAHPTPNQVINLLDKDVIKRTVQNFPVTQRLEYGNELFIVNNNADCNVKSLLEEIVKDNIIKFIIKDNETIINNLVIQSKHRRIVSSTKDSNMVSHSHLEANDGIYDPAFLLPLLSHLLAPGSVASCFRILRSGLLSIPVMALSSHCPLMRAAAYHVLHRFCLLLETETRHKNDKLLLSDFMDTLRQSLPSVVHTEQNDNGSDLKNPRLPTVGALYLARSLMVSTASFHPLYKPVNNFFIAKQFVDLTVVPDFLSLFHDSDVESLERRLWILDVIRDGIKSMSDVNVVFKTMCLKMIMDYYSSVLCDRKTRERILSVLNSIISIPKAFDILVEGYGLMSWLHAVIRLLRTDDKILVKELLILVKNMLYSMFINSFSRNFNSGAKNGKAIEKLEFKVNKDVEIKILNILYSFLHHIDVTEDENVVSYLDVYRLLSRRTIKSLTKEQMLNLINITGVNVDINMISRAFMENNVAMLQSDLLNTTDSESKKSLLTLLRILVLNYLT